MNERPHCRVLVVEDEAMIAMLVEDMILEFGSEVVGPASKIEEALVLAREADLDAAILDVKVGEAVVFPVADLLGERGIPFIFATGYGAAALPMRFIGSPTLAKPFSFDLLSHVLRTALAGQPCHTAAA